MKDFVIGLDIGTGGARALAAGEDGSTLAEGSHILPPPFMDENGVSEQVAGSWKIAAMAALKQCLEEARKNDISPDGLRAICVDGTSGTVVFLDEEDTPILPGILHNDTRAAEEAHELNDRLADHCREMGYRFGPSFALPKILWTQRHKPLFFEKVRRIEHQCDYVIGSLTGHHGYSDPSNALKTGYNLINGRWPREFEEMGLASLLPKIVPSGEVVGIVRTDIARELGIPAETPVLAGVTDSTAAFLATGATRMGEVATTLGTTLAFKTISRRLVHDPYGVVYNHRHPGGGWLPGGASNVGGACLKYFFKDKNLASLDHAAANLKPTATLCYPLVETGERFPFDAPQARGFFDKPKNDLDQYLALLQGVALVEKWCIQRLEDLGIVTHAPFFITGSGSRSEVWSQIRANILQRPLACPLSTGSAMGVAVLAGAHAFYQGDLAMAGRKMVRLEMIYAPDFKLSDWAHGMLDELKHRCHERGWV